VDARDRFRRTPLLVAAGEGHEAVARLLLEHGADIDARDIVGAKAVEWAVYWGHHDLARARLGGASHGDGATQV
jgi:ankyrin repeat protein